MCHDSRNTFGCVILILIFGVVGMLFEYIRLSLFEREGFDFDWRKKANGAPFMREEWLRDVFSREVPFIHRKNSYVFVPDGEVEQSTYIVGRIGRPTISVENEPPEGDLHETTREIWRAAITIIDPADHSDGQKAAVQVEANVGKPIGVFASLASALNQRLPPEPFLMEVHGITDSQTFWQYVSENAGSITNITFEVAAPNMFRSVDDFSQEMRELRDTEKVKSARIELNNPDGLNPNTQRVRDAVNYTVKGGGAIKARARGKKPYNSRNKTRRIRVAKSKPSDSDKTLLTAIKDALSRVFL